MGTRAWDVSGLTGEHVVTVQRSENGKDVVRVDGRVAAKPIGDDEMERRLAIDGTTYILRRVGDGFELDLDDSAPAPQHFAPPISGPKVAPPPRKEPFPIGRIIGILFILAFVGGIVWFLREMMPSYEKHAVQRVENMLREAAKFPDGQETAIALFAKDALRLTDQGELAWAVGAYPRFMNKYKLRRKFSSWKVIDSEPQSGVQPQTVIVTVEVEGQRMRMVVPDKMPMTWAE